MHTHMHIKHVHIHHTPISHAHTCRIAATTSFKFACEIAINFSDFSQGKTRCGSQSTNLESWTQLSPLLTLLTQEVHAAAPRENEVWETSRNIQSHSIHVSRMLPEARSLCPNALILYLVPAWHTQSANAYRHSGLQFWLNQIVTILSLFLIQSLAVSHLVLPWFLSTQKQTSTPLHQPALQCHPVAPSPVTLFELSSWFTFFTKHSRYPPAAHYLPGWSQVLTICLLSRDSAFEVLSSVTRRIHSKAFGLASTLKGIGLPVNSLIRITLRHIFRVLIQWWTCRILFIV